MIPKEVGGVVSSAMHCRGLVIPTEVGGVVRYILQRSGDTYRGWWCSELHTTDVGGSIQPKQVLLNKAVVNPYVYGQLREQTSHWSQKSKKIYNLHQSF